MQRAEHLAQNHAYQRIVQSHIRQLFQQFEALQDYLYVVLKHLHLQQLELLQHHLLLPGHTKYLPKQQK